MFDVKFLDEGNAVLVLHEHVWGQASSNAVLNPPTCSMMVLASNMYNMRYRIGKSSNLDRMRMFIGKPDNPALSAREAPANPDKQCNWWV